MSTTPTSLPTTGAVSPALQEKFDKISHPPHPHGGDADDDLHLAPGAPADAYFEVAMLAREASSTPESAKKVYNDLLASPQRAARTASTTPHHHRGHPVIAEEYTMYKCTLPVLLSISDRCEAHTPKLDNDFVAQAAAELPSESVSTMIYLKAEHAIEVSQLGSAWDEAHSLFERACAMFTADCNYLMAGNCMIRCADCRRFLHDDDGEAACFLEASELFASLGADESLLSSAIHAVELAEHSYSKRNRHAKSAKLLRRLAELKVNLDSSPLAEAIGLLKAASELYRGELDMEGDARQCHRRAIELTIVGECDHAQTIDLIEELHSFSPVFDSPGLLLRALLCRFVCVPLEYGLPFFDAIVDVKEYLDRYSEVSASFVHSQERTLIVKILAATEKMESSIAEEAIALYIECHDLEAWVVDLLRVCHENIETRSRSVSKIYSL